MARLRKREITEAWKSEPPVEKQFAVTLHGPESLVLFVTGHAAQLFADHQVRYKLRFAEAFVMVPYGLSEQEAYDLLQEAARKKRKG